jgi:hypothetical protein
VLFPVGVDAHDQNLLEGAPFYNAFIGHDPVQVGYWNEALSESKDTSPSEGMLMCH